MQYAIMLYQIYSCYKTAVGQSKTLQFPSAIMQQAFSKPSLFGEKHVSSLGN
jgi:hypothetical protein